MIYTFQREIAPDKLHRELVAGCPKYDFLSSETTETEERIIEVSTKSELTLEEFMALQAIVDAHVAIDDQEIVKAEIRRLIRGSQDIIEQFAMENVLMGITEAGKTRLIADAVAPVMYYLQTGALTVAIQELTILEITAPMAPFLTEARRTQYVEKLQALLAIT